MHEDIGYDIIGAAMEVHNILGPGLLESAYKTALAHELRLQGFNVKTEVKMNFRYKGIPLEDAYRADILVNDEVIVELKAVSEVKPIFKMQLLTYLKLSGLKLGYLINFNSSSLVNNHSYFRIVNKL